VHEIALASFWFYQYAWNHIGIVGDKKLITYTVYDRISKENLINMQLFERVATKGHLIRKDYHNKSCNMHKDKSKQKNSKQDIFVRRDELIHASETLLRS
jgi:hypothetical protein